MRFLVDNLLPPALARLISQLGMEAAHVADAGLRASSDAERVRVVTAFDASKRLIAIYLAGKSFE